MRDRLRLHTGPNLIGGGLADDVHEVDGRLRLPENGWVILQSERYFARQ